jgi:methionine synthase / methylenetetrahydrofolate reductase(NADPH)
VSARNAEFMANEVPGVVVPPEIVGRMQRASEKSREHALQEGIAIAREMFEAVRADVQGLQVSAPFGRVQFALQVFDGLPGIRTDISEEAALSADTFGFPPPQRRTSSSAGPASALPVPG